MDLHYRHIGKGPPLIVLHGLYGSSDNWITVGRILSEKFEVFLPDQRNHGNSPHSKEHNYMLLKNDLLGFMDRQNINKAIIIGHSMGGKVAMFFAADYPERIQSLIVVDISPGSYKSLQEPMNQITLHMNIISTMMAVNFSEVKSRTDVDSQLATGIPSRRIRQFLLKNVTRDNKGKYSWKLNIGALYNNLPEIMDGLNIQRITKGDKLKDFPVLFIKGEKSDYITESDYPAIYTLFPEAEIVSIPGAGHWLHAEQPELFIKTVTGFLKEQ